MHYRALDDEYFEVFMATSSSVFEKIGGSAFPNTYRCMAMFCAKTNSLKTAMFDCVDSNNPYAFKILFRCFCEHYLKFMYVWSRFAAERNDEAGKDFYSYCGAIEAQEYVDALAVGERLVGNDVVVQARNAIAKLYPEASTLSTGELAKKSGQFKYRAILRFLAGEQFKFIAAERPFLATIAPAYALLSSFVHGGPYADMEMEGFSKPAALKECHKNAEVVVLMSASVYLLTSSVVAREYPAITKVSAAVNAVLKRGLSKK